MAVYIKKIKSREEYSVYIRDRVVNEKVATIGHASKGYYVLVHGKMLDETFTSVEQAEDFIRSAIREGIIKPSNPKINWESN